MNVFLQNLATKLSSLGYGVPGQTIFAGQLPSSPAVLTCILQQGGSESPSNPIKRAQVWIWHRNTHCDSGYEFVWRIYRDINNIPNVLSCYPGRFNSLTFPGNYNIDAAQRFIFGSNYVFTTLKNQ